MFFLSLAFVAGNLFALQLHQLPTLCTQLLIIVFVVIVKRVFTHHQILTNMLIALTAGLLWCTWSLMYVNAWVLPLEIEGKPVNIVGRVASIPIFKQQALTFQLQLDEIKQANNITRPHQLILISWRYDKTTLNLVHSIRVGHQLNLLVTMKRIHGLRNPGGFDYEAWALMHGLRASARVLPSQNNKIVSHDLLFKPLEQLRDKFYLHVQYVLPESNISHWLLALMLGERVNIPQDQWQVLRRTGTNHLMAIGGLHIGMLALIVKSLVSQCWRRIPRLIIIMPAQESSAIAALLAAWLYSLQAGFSIPTQRAAIMLSIFVGIFLQRRRISAWNSWVLTMLLVLLINPLILLSESFWLSFGTIALIIFGMSGRLSPMNLWWQWGRVQWVIAVGLIPWSLLFFQECSLTSSIANSIAIPWLEFLILPFCLLSTICLFIMPWAAKSLLLLAAISLSGLWHILTWIANWPFTVWIKSVPSIWLLLIGCIGCIGLLIPNGIPGRYLAIIWLSYFLCYRAPVPALGDVWLTLLDVGQGLSAVVQTNQHTLVFDAGGKMNESNDLGEQVVVPYLHSMGVNHIDMMIISHGDNDHSGGAAAVLNAFPVSQRRTSVPGKFFWQSSYCIAGESWQWDNIRFSFLSPFKDTLGQGNDSSCVLLIEQGERSILLPGDIEANAEQTLLQRYKPNKPVTILVAPHHGSKTSSTEDFVNLFHPRYVLYATGNLNRYHFPSDIVIERYKKQQTQQLNTATTGAIQFKMEKASRFVSYHALRDITC